MTVKALHPPVLPSVRYSVQREGRGKQEGNFPHFPKRKRFFPNPEAREWTRSNCPGNQNLHSVISREREKKTSEEQELNVDSVTKSNLKTNSPIQRFLRHTYSRWTPFITAGLFSLRVSCVIIVIACIFVLYDTHNATSMPSAAFEPAVPASERPQTLLAVDARPLKLAQDTLRCEIQHKACSDLAFIRHKRIRQFDSHWPVSEQLSLS